MEIVDAFTQEAIENYDTNIEGTDEEILQGVIKQVFTTNNINWSDEILQVAMLCFVAGRTYQMDLTPQWSPSTIDLPMSGKTIAEFIEYLSERGAP